MTTYILTVNTDALGLGIISGGRVVVERRRTSAAQQYPGFDVLYAITAYTNASGVATLGLKPDDSSVYHEARIYDTSGVVVYRTIFSMLPENIALLEVTGAILGENSIQFKDEGVSLGTPVATNNIDFTGNAVTASFADGTITVNITKPTTAADISAEPAGAVTTHTGAVDPHGDRAYAESLVVGLWDDRGNYNASVNAYPSSGGSGTAGAILKGDIWTISVGGTLPTAQVVGVGDTVRALIDTPGNTQANWAIQEQNIGYTPENSSNKSTSTSLGSSDTLYPSQKAVKGYVDTSIAALNTPPNMAVSITREHKFGQFTRSSTNPNGVYSFQGPSGGGYVTLTTTKLATISGGAAISDALYWNITVVDSGAGFALSTAVWSQTSSNVVTTRWQTGDKMQAIFSLSLTDLAPSPTDDFVFRVGFANTTSQAITKADVFSSGTSGAHDGSAAFFFADKDSAYWKCESGHLTTTETTVTTVAVAIDVLHVFHVVIATNGAVSFYIDGGLVATHNTGVIASGKGLNESMGFRNRAVTATANKGCILDQIEFQHELANQRTGFAFV